MSESMPDIEGAMRTWLRTQAGVTALVGQRIFFEVPTKASTWPLITISRVGGGDDEGDTPLDLPTLSIDVYGDMNGQGHGDKAGATAVVNAVRSALRGIRGRTTLTDSVDAFGAEVAGVVWSPDPDNGRPHYAITVGVTAISS